MLQLLKPPPPLPVMHKKNPHSTIPCLASHHKTGGAMILVFNFSSSNKQHQYGKLIHSLLSKFMFSCRSDAVTLPDPLRSASPNSSFSFSGSLLDLSLSDVPLGSVSVNQVGWLVSTFIPDFHLSLEKKKQLEAWKLG